MCSIVSATMIRNHSRIIAAITLIIVAVAIGLFLGLHSTWVNGESMEPTLSDGEVGHRVHDGDIVVFHDGSRNLVKRVVAIGGDHVTINHANGLLTVNGAVKAPGYEYGCSTSTDLHMVMTSGTMLVVGDNVNHSNDSRWRWCSHRTHWIMQTDQVIMRIRYAIGVKGASAWD